MRQENPSSVSLTMESGTPSKKKMQPLVSYVITLFNKQRFLHHLMAGLIGQQGAFRKEMIFVDDGSTDGTVEALRKITANCDNVVIIEQENAGPAVAMNAGLAYCTGDFIKPVDGDDMLLPWATRYLLEAINETGCSVAYGDMNRLGHYHPRTLPDEALAAVASEPRCLRRERNSLRLSLRSARTNPTTWLATADVVRHAGGCDPGVFIQDYSLELRLAAVTDFALLENTLFLAPDEAEDRLSKNKAQTLHDVNLATVRFLRDHPDLQRRMRTYGMRRVSGRAWAWASRHGGKGIISREFVCRVLALIGCLPPVEANEEMLCAPFRKTNHIRLTDAYYNT